MGVLTLHGNTRGHGPAVLLEDSSILQPRVPLVPRAPHIPSTPPYCPELQSPGSYTISSGALHGSTRMLSELSQVTKKEKRGK